MRLNIAFLALLAAVTGSASTAGAQRWQVAVRGTYQGAVIRIADVSPAHVELRRPRPEQLIVVLPGAQLRTDAFHPDASWIESVRILGADVLGVGESRIVVTMTNSMLQPRVEDDPIGAAVVLEGMRRRPFGAPPLPPRHAARPAEGADAVPLAPPPRPRERTPTVREERVTPLPPAPPPSRGARPAPARPAATAPASGPAPGPATPPPTHSTAGEMAWVPGGENVMGTPSGEGFADEAPEHLVSLDGFWMDRTEVSVWQFQQSPLTLPRQPEWNWAADQPVVNVTWHEAARYCSWAGKRLPTEAEWERAARGDDARRFPWGNRFNVARVNSGMDGDGYTHAAPVGSLPEGASPWGILHLSGNVWEWVADWYGDDYYERSPAHAPQGPSHGSQRVTRGGSFEGRSATNVRAPVRLPLKASARRENVGFRCASD